MASERRVSWALPVKVAAWLLLGLLVAATGKSWYEGQYGQVALPREMLWAASTSPGGEWQLRAYAFSDDEFMWAEVRARGSARWRRIYFGPGASASWADADTVVFVEDESSARHRVDVRTGDYGVMPHGTFGKVFAWAQIVGVSLVVLVIGAAIIIVAPRLVTRARLARARRRGAAESGP